MSDQEDEQDKKPAALPDPEERSRRSSGASSNCNIGLSASVNRIVEALQNAQRNRSQVGVSAETEEQILASAVASLLSSQELFGQLEREHLALQSSRRFRRAKASGPRQTPPIKTVSFSSISAPPDEDSVDEELAVNAVAKGDVDSDASPFYTTRSEDEYERSRYHRRRQRNKKGGEPFRPLSTHDRFRLSRSMSPSILRNHISETNTTTPADTASASGEATASGDSSVASGSQLVAQGQAHHHVHFSAINPNPQLVLANETTSGLASFPVAAEAGLSPTVRFHVDRTVSFQDEVDIQAPPEANSRNSRSGLSSPTIDPALSPPQSRSPRTRIHFANDPAIETITEVAARLRQEQQHEIADGEQHGRMVHFSALRDVTVIHSDDAASELFHAPPRTDQAEPDVVRDSSSPTVHFSEDTMAAATQSSTIPSPTEAEMAMAAERLRRLIRRAEQVDNVTLEAAFEHFNQDHSGAITASDLQRGLLSLGSTFNFSLEECRALMEHLAGEYAHPHFHSIDEEPRITLLGFYRAMGRRSPPPEAEDEGAVHPSELNDDDDENEAEFEEQPSPSHILRRSSSSLRRELASSTVVHAQDAANRLRRMVLDAEQNDDWTLEGIFRLLDVNHTGRISPADFERGLQELGRCLGADAFASISEADCEQLVALFDTNRDGRVSLLDFYRFMGQRSPPLSRTASDDEGGTFDRVD